MDYTAIGTAIVSGVISIAAVSMWLSKVMPKVSGWTVLAKDAVETITDISLALTPDPITGKVEITKEEIAKINADVVAFRAQLAVLIGK